MSRPRPLGETETRVWDLLRDGKPRTAGEIGQDLNAGGEFVAQRELGRVITRSLASLRERELVQRLQYSVRRSGGTHQLIERYVAAKAILPVCLPCWRTYWDMSAPPPQVPGFAQQSCTICSRRTNAGAYPPREEVLERKDRACAT